MTAAVTKPATALPWDFAITEHGPTPVDSDGDPLALRYIGMEEADAAYIAHAANAYPQLVAALQGIFSGNVDAGTFWKVDVEDMARARLLLREIGEDVA